MRQREEIDIMAELSLDTRVEDDLAIITAVGEIDLSTSDRFAATVSDAIDQGCREIIIEMLGVTFIDSIGISAVVAIRQHLRPLDGTLSLVGLQDRVWKSISFAGLGAVLAVYDDLEAARASGA